jgi:hypothetical protein
LPQRPSLARTLLGRLFIAVLLGLAVLAGLVRAGVVVIPDRHNPFAPLRIADEPNWLTGYKLRRLAGDPQQCQTVLSDSALAFTPLPDRVTGEGCGFTNAVDVERSAVLFNSGFPASCPLAASWAMFERHVLQAAARRHFGREVARVDHFGTYACRNLYHRERGRRSEHATANAIDVAGFVLDDGTPIVVKGDWGGGGAKAAFLVAVRDGACRFFNVTLGPDYNEAHRDHFHFDMGRQRACR